MAKKPTTTETKGTAGNDDPVSSVTAAPAVPTPPPPGGSEIHPPSVREQTTPEGSTETSAAPLAIEPEAVPLRALKIVSKAPRRRAGRRWTQEPATVLMDDLSLKELESLQRDPQLSIQEIVLDPEKES